MRLNLKGTNTELTPDIREYLDKRLVSLSKLIDLEDPAVLLDVELGRTTRHHQTGDVFRAEINIHRGSETFRAVAETESLTAAIDLMRDEIAGELTSGKGKKQSLLRRGGLMAKQLLRMGTDGFDEWVGAPTKRGFTRLKSFRPWKK